VCVLLLIGVKRHKLKRIKEEKRITKEERKEHDGKKRHRAGTRAQRKEVGDNKAQQKKQEETCEKSTK
jgi:hypothetical protein